MEREDDALYAIKNKIRHLEDMEEDIHQARREIDDILYHMKEVWRGEHAEHTFWQIEDEVNHYNRRTACMTNDIHTELNNEQKSIDKISTRSKLNNRILKGDDVAMATKSTVENLYIAGTKQLTGFGREYEYLLQHGYTYDVKTSTMKLKK